ncbi:Small GTP binding protein rab1a [Oopsacas minuta]|uniref:Small GTP binding protein rab1a n=1 Tax=Oopsacas minuta TaxID=111878 RepID=A0AAV7KB76_9METZ|nr:Small GTP binding protein rab1a [Oopsacas minuta]
MTDIFHYPTYRIAIIGSLRVGKSSIVKQFASNTELNTSYNPTICIDFSTHNIQLDGIKIKLQLWDTQGIRNHLSISPSYYRFARGTILVFDVTNRESFDKLEDYPFEPCNFTHKETRLILVANKCDLIEERKISYETGKEFADAHNLLYFEVSCKSHEQVEYAIVSLASLIVENEKRNEYILKQKNNSNVGSTHSREAARDSSKCNLL